MAKGLTKNAGDTMTAKIGERADYVRLSKLRWTRYMPASCALMFVFGLSYALSAFELFLHQRYPPLVPAYTSALGVQSFVCAMTLCFGAYYLDYRPNHVRQFTLLGCALILFQSVAGSAAQTSNVSLLWLSTSLEGLGTGMFYLVGVEHSAKWMPDRPGLAMSLAMGSMGIGQIFGAKIFAVMGRLFGVVNAMHAATLLFVLPSLMSVTMLMYPPDDWDPRGDVRTGTAAASNNTGVKLGWNLLTQWHFYALLVIVAMGAGPGFGLLSGFPTVVHGLYGLSDTMASSLFSGMSFLSMLARFITGFVVDFCGYSRGFFWSGGKNLAMLVLLAQTLALLSMRHFGEHGSFAGVMICIAVLFVSLAASAVLAAVLARQMFSPRNAAVVFGFAAGLTDGLSTMIFGIYMANVEERAKLAADPAKAYYDYFSFTTFFSFFGFVAAVLIRRCNAAFEEELGNGDVKVYVEQLTAEEDEEARGMQIECGATLSTESSSNNETSRRTLMPAPWVPVAVAEPDYVSYIRHRPDAQNGHINYGSTSNSK